MESSKKTFLVMKLAATILMVGLLTLFFFHSNDSSQIFTQKAAHGLLDLSPAHDRNAPIDVTALPIQKDAIVHLNFWAEWCEPCIRELPVLEKMQKENIGRYQIILINLDTKPESIEKARNIQRLLAPSTTAIFENFETLAEKNGVNAIPFHIVLDKKGRVAMKFFADLEKHQAKFTKQLHQLFAEAVPAN